VHLEAGMMQALLDGELNEEKASKLKEHLKECADCQKLYSELKENQDFNQKVFKSFEGLTLKRNFKFEKKKGLKYMLKKSKKGMAVIGVGLVLAIFIAFPPARAVAEDFLQIFRVNRLETVEITAQDIEEMRNVLENAQGTVDLKEFGSLTASNVSYEAKDTTIDKAQKVLGFELKEARYLPFDLKSKDYTMIEPGEVKFNLNVDKVNSFINSLGGTKLLPQELNGQEFAIEFGGSLTIVYFPADKSSNVIILNETSLPEVTVPEGINAEGVKPLPYGRWFTGMLILLLVNGLAPFRLVVADDYCRERPCAVPSGRVAEGVKPLPYDGIDDKRMSSSSSVYHRFRRREGA